MVVFSKSERDKQEVDGWAGEKPLQATESVTAELQLTAGVVVFSKSERDKQRVMGGQGRNRQSEACVRDAMEK